MSATKSLSQPRSRAKASVPPSPCPCGSGLAYDSCCGRYHGGEPAPTPAALMRSRYTAYALGLNDYLKATWAPETCPPDLDASTPPLPKWLGLEIRHQGEDGDQGVVEFVARYKVGGRAHRMQEKSRFERRDGRWVYVAGEVAED